MANDNQPIIIKRIKKGGHGHHGGAWKVALADFVTAMMAFFMLMWLMGSTTPEQKAAISDYFNNPNAVPAAGGASSSMIRNGGEMEPQHGEGEKPLQAGKGTQDSEEDSGGGKATIDDLMKDNDKKASAADVEQAARAQERQRMQSLLDDLKAAIDSGQALKPFKDQLLLDITNEGLRIQIVDKENRPMFAKGSATLEDYAAEILTEIAKVIDQVPNRISVTGHTDQTPFTSRAGYSNWELSADRANAARRALVMGGMPDAKIGRVVGLSSSVLYKKTDPFDPINRRISIIVMNKVTDDAIASGESKGSPDDKADASPMSAPATNQPAAAAAKGVGAP